MLHAFVTHWAEERQQTSAPLDGIYESTVYAPVQMQAEEVSTGVQEKLSGGEDRYDTDVQAQGLQLP